MILAGKLYETRIFARPRHRWEGNIETNIKETVFVLNGLHEASPKSKDTSRVGR